MRLDLTILAPYLGFLGQGALLTAEVWGLSLLGFKLPLNLPWLLAVALQVIVIWFIWKGWKAARRSPRNQVRLFNAQEHWANAFALQALILFLW